MFKFCPQLTILATRYPRYTISATLKNQRNNMSTSPLYNKKEAQRYWDLSLPAELKENETVRVVSQVKEPDGTYGKFGILTIKDQIKSTKDIYNFIDRLQMNNPGKSVGVSISTTVFEFNGKPPSTDNFRYTNTISIDIDTHIGNTKERYVLGTLDEDQIEYSVMRTWLEINRRFKETGLENIIPIACTLTGGGLQFVLGFDRALNQSEAQRLFGLIKNAIKDLKWKTVLRDILGEYTPVDHDIDSSFADIVHVQRMAGTVNQKYSIMSRFIDVFDRSGKDLLDLKDQLQEEIKDKNYTDSQIKAYSDEVNQDVMTFINDRSCARESFEVEDNLTTAKMMQARSSLRPSDFKNIEYELLQKVKRTGIHTLTLFQGDVKVGQESGNLTKLYCPFHEETNPSMAFYENEMFDVFKDFHDDQTYNLITFWEKLYNVSKSTAISQIAERAGVPLAKSERKDFQNLEIDEIIDELVSRIDHENFIYYRLASKNRNCIVRHIDTGESFVFDGPKMLANHILQNQLNIKDAEKALVEEFSTRFQERVLIDAFEEFYPGKPAIFQKEFIKFVNLWVPNKNYRKVHERLQEEKDSLSNEESIALIKKRTPWTYKFLLQMIQSGDLPWFINWMSTTANFNPVPVVPVIYGCPGAGKNLFINVVMEFYFGQEYTKVVSGDRVGQQFNSVLETASLLVLDESDFASNREFDSLKFMTGNETIMIEKKGVDVVARRRHFNVMLFSNGEVPLRHAASDRRITYYNNEITLLASTNTWKVSIDEFIDNVKEELVEFWAIICRTTLNRKQAMINVKDGGFWRQVMKMHPAGSLILKLMDNQWNDIALQLNENVTDDAEMKINLELLETIRGQFQSNGSISMALINRYLQSLNFRMKTSVQRFVSDNHLAEFGIDTTVTDSNVQLVVDRRKVRNSIKTNNILRAAYPATSKEIVNDLEAEIQADSADATYFEDTLMEIEETKDDLQAPPAPSL